MGDTMNRHFPPIIPSKPVSISMHFLFRKSSNKIADSSTTACWIYRCDNRDHTLPTTSNHSQLPTIWEYTHTHTIINAHKSTGHLATSLCKSNVVDNANIIYRLCCIITKWAMLFHYHPRFLYQFII